MDRPRLVLAEDHRCTAALLRDLLQSEFEVVAVVHDGEALVRAAEDFSPHVIVSDISMPLLDGIAAAARILERNPDARIVFVSIHDDPRLVDRALATGAMGYVVKISAGEDLAPAARAALNGRSFVSGAIRRRRETAAPATE